jgi:signal transduction histidine kinase
VARAAGRAISRRGSANKRHHRARRTIDEITNMRRAIEAKYGRPAAQQSQRMCDRYSQILVGSMVHDLSTLHAAIVTDCLSLMDEVGRRRRVPMRLRATLDLTERAINDMRAYTTPLQMEPTRQCLTELVQRALDMARENALRQRIDPDSISVETSIAELISVEVSPHLIVIALANVLTNAFEAFPVESRKGQIQISAKVAAGAVEIVIRDNGQGIVGGELVDPSFLLPGRRNKSKRFSTGYGLPIAMRNLAAHGGTLSLKSREHEGTTVTINLPLRAGKEVAIDESASAGR